ncbi:Hypothetical protein PFR_JS12-1_1913 [Propionibacterium freudenreichii]|nr:Hypothetical protein PFR_JS12-2_1912 [Propionibacterium freudenreichii]SCC97881.1 Hypothetical protein PFR_JS12-1_1913 [Propionibacterium freudenreichii]
MVRFVGVFEQGDAGASMKGPSRRRGNRISKLPDGYVECLNEGPLQKEGQSQGRLAAGMQLFLPQ